MNQTLRDAFARLQDDAGRFDVDLQALVDGGETRLRRRRLTAVLGGTVAVVVAITIGVGIALNGPTTRSQGPAHPPPAHGTKNAGTDEAPPTRQIVYSDQKIGVDGNTVHFGDRPVETGNNHVHLDVTDDGFLFTDRGGVWFSDGGTPVRVGTTCPSASNGEFGNFANRLVMTANSGSTAAWFDCTHGRSELVVYDTDSQHEVARQHVPFCCELVDVTSEYVYLNRGDIVGAPRPEVRFDVRANQARVSTLREYAEELRSRPRGLVVGEDWESGTPITHDGRTLPVDGQLSFTAVGSRLVPVVSVNDGQQVTSAFDTATRRALRLRLPAGYHAKTTTPFTIFEWLNDDTVALVGGGADILTCPLPTGRCVIAVPGPDKDTWRLVPNFPLPG